MLNRICFLFVALRMVNLPLIPSDWGGFYADLIVSRGKIAVL